MADPKPTPALDWTGKTAPPRVSPHVLVEDAALSCHADAAHDGDGDNLLVYGDNLPALDALAEAWAGRVKCVYIDPPFNTGGAFANYDDGVEHAAWLSAMQARVRYIRTLLRNDGSLLVHLDDNEMDYLKVLLDEELGRSNFVGRITIDARSPSAFSTVNPGVFKASEYLLWYAKDRASFVANEVRVPRAPDPAYNQWLINPSDPPAAWTFCTLRQAFAEAPRRPGDTLEQFVVANAARVCRLTAISDTGAGRATIAAKALSRTTPGRVVVVDRGPDKDGQFVYNGQQIVFYDKNVVTIDGVRTASRLLTNVWTDIAWEGIAGEGGVRFKKGKKPEKLLKRCLELCTRPGDVVLDCFAGSGTTAAVAHKLGRRWIAIEQGEHVLTHCVPRLRAVIDGTDRAGVSTAVGWTGGGGFRFYRLLPAEGRKASVGAEGSGPDATPG
jgi:adenine-specific DNA-methyltransferase